MYYFRLASVSAVRPRLVELEHAVPGDRAGAAEVRWDARPQFRGDDLRQDQRIIAEDHALAQHAARALGVAEGVGVVRLDEPDVLPSAHFVVPLGRGVRVGRASGR